MKTISSLFLAVCFPLSGLCQWNPIGNIQVSNAVVVAPTFTGSSNYLYPGAINLYGVSGGPVPRIGFINSANGWSSTLRLDDAAANQLDLTGNLRAANDVDIVGDLNVQGTLTTVSAVTYTTNNVSVTNATWANNVWYPTNRQTSVDINMGIAYSDYDTAVAPTFTVNGNALSPTNYQTAVVFVRQNPPSANVLALTIPAEASRQGTFNLTNVTVLTWFYNPHIPLTNVVALPLY